MPFDSPAGNEDRDEGAGVDQRHALGCGEVARPIPDRARGVHLAQGAIRPDHTRTGEGGAAVRFDFETGQRGHEGFDGVGARNGVIVGQPELICALGAGGGDAFCKATRPPEIAVKAQRAQGRVCARTVLKSGGSVVCRGIVDDKGQIGWPRLPGEGIENLHQLVRAVAGHDDGDEAGHGRATLPVRAARA